MDGTSKQEQVPIPPPGLLPSPLSLIQVRISLGVKVKAWKLDAVGTSDPVATASGGKYEGNSQACTNPGGTNVQMAATGIPPSFAINMWIHIFATDNQGGGPGGNSGNICTGGDQLN
jgi:hypothetical protein